MLIYFFDLTRQCRYSVTILILFQSMGFELSPMDHKNIRQKVKVASRTKRVRLHGVDIRPK